MESNGLREQLIAIQNAHRWTDETMARHLGITRVYWFRIRTGQQRGGRKLLVGVVQGFPELASQAIEYLRQM